MSDDENSERKNPFDGLTVQEDLKEDLEDKESEDLFVEYGRGKSSENHKTEFIDKWFPSEKQLQGKTDIELHQARCLALIRHLDTHFHEIEELGEFLRNVISDYELYRTSVDGKSRKEQVQVMRAMFGADSSEETTENMMTTLLAGQMGDNDD